MGGLGPFHSYLTLHSGSLETKKYYNQLADSYNPKQYWADIHDWNMQVIQAKGKKALEKAGKLRPKNWVKRVKKEDEVASKPLEINDEGQQQPDEESAAVKDEDGDIDMSVDTTLTASPPAKEEAKPQNYYEGKLSAKQLHESVAEFLTRLPPSTTTNIHAQDHWIWICNPFPLKPRDRKPEDLATFRQLGTRLLDDFLTRKSEVEAENPNKPAQVVTKKLKPTRDSLESNISTLAKQQGITAGKWMLFPAEGQVDQLWDIVCNATWDGKLSECAKVATARGDPESTFDALFEDGENPGAARDVRNTGQRLICIYTSDFSDKEEILRVLRAIKDLGLINIDGMGEIGTTGCAGSLKQIYYKCDAHTYLDISSGNEYKLKASMYGSKELMPQWYPEGSANGNSRGSGFGGRGGGRSTFRGGAAGFRRRS